MTPLEHLDIAEKLLLAADSMLLGQQAVSATVVTGPPLDLESYVAVIMAHVDVAKLRKDLEPDIKAAAEERRYR